MSAGDAPAEARFTDVHLAHGILERNGRVLLAASRYPNHPAPLWNLPGGRRRPGELLDAALRREFVEETGLVCEVLELRYVAESVDRATGTQFTAFIFGVSAHGAARRGDDVHVTDLDWVPLDALHERLTVPVVRDPLLGHLADPRRRYFSYADSGITIVFADEP